jgi:hypothetical protein
MIQNYVMQNLTQSEFDYESDPIFDLKTYCGE